MASDGGPARIYVDLYEVPAERGDGRPTRRPQKWRWRALNSGNHRILAVSSESYTNETDAKDAIWDLFGGESNVTLRQAGKADQPLVVAS